MARVVAAASRGAGSVGHGCARVPSSIFTGPASGARSAGELEGAVRCEAGGETARIEPDRKMASGLVGERLAHRKARGFRAPGIRICSPLGQLTRNASSHTITSISHANPACLICWPRHDRPASPRNRQGM